MPLFSCEALEGFMAITLLFKEKLREWRGTETTSYLSAANDLIS